MERGRQVTTGRKPQIAAYADEEAVLAVEKIQAMYPKVTKSQIIVGAVKHFAKVAELCGLDANLQPLEPHEIS